MTRSRLDRCSRILKRFAVSRDGVTAIEFSLLAFPFFLIVFAVFEIALIFVADVALDRASEKTMRIVRTGEAYSLHYSEQRIRDTMCDQLLSIFDCSQLKIDLRERDQYSDIPLVPPVVAGKLATGDFGFDLGGSEAIMLLRVYYEWPIATQIFRSILTDLDSGNFLLSSVSIARVEPFNAATP